MRRRRPQLQVDPVHNQASPAENSQPPSQDPSSGKALMMQLYESWLVQDTNFVSGLHKVFTVALVVFYFSVVEKIPLSQCLTQNAPTLAILVSWAHISSCFNLDFQQVYWQKLGSETKPEWIFRVGKVVFKYVNLAVFVIVCALWPLLAWLDFGFTNLDTDYYALRYFLQVVYMVSQNVPYSAIDNMQMLIGDGFFLVQITSMLLYNTGSLKAMVFAMAPLLLFQNGKMCFDILNFVKEPFEKTTFVRLVGTHDSVYLLIMFTLLVSLMSVMDALATDAVHLVNLAGIPLVMYLFVKIMDTKQARLANSFFPLVALIFTLFQIYIYLAAHAAASKTATVEQPTYPLYVPKPPEAASEATVAEGAEGSEPVTWMSAIWARCSLGGLWFFLDWVLYPFWNWIVVPWWNWTIAPIVYPILGFFSSTLGWVAGFLFKQNDTIPDDMITGQPSIDDL